MYPASVAERGVVRIPIPRLRQHQQPVADHPARFKVVRAGRRWGKDRLAFTVSIVGHGLNREHPGLIHGTDVCWVAPVYPQAKHIWVEEIRPRFRGLPGVMLNETELTVTLPNGARLFLRSADAVEGILGVGKNLGGLVVNEAARLDLEYAWRDVLFPILTDNMGWALITSVPNGGLDGNYLKVIPSYFNRLCQEIMAGGKDSEWAHFYGTAHDNPTLPAKGVAGLVADYPPESVKLKEQVYAELVVGGGGLAFPELNERVHLIPADRFRIMPHWLQFGAFDWGFSHPWVFIWFVVNEDGDVFVVDTVRGRRQQPAEIADRVLSRVPVEQLRYIHSGDDIGRGMTYVDEDVPTYQDRLAEYGLFVQSKRISRPQAYDNLRDFLRWRGAGPDGEDWTPRLRFLDLPMNRWLFDQLQYMVTDPLHPEDVLKVNADRETGEGGDDGYDALKLGLASRAPTSHKPRSPWHEEQVDAFAPEVLEHEARESRRSKRHQPKREYPPEAVT